MRDFGSNGTPRIGVYVCHCGTNIAGTVDVKAVADYAAVLPGVVVSRRVDFKVRTNPFSRFKYGWPVEFKLHDMGKKLTRSLGIVRGPRLAQRAAGVALEGTTHNVRDEAGSNQGPAD